MSKKSTLIGGLMTLIFFGFAATSFAGMGIPGNAPNIGTKAGVDIVASDQAKELQQPLTTATASWLRSVQKLAPR